MKITFLGTGTSQGVPVIACPCPVCSSLDFRDKRLRTSVHIQTDELSIVIDSGPDFRQQMLRERILRLDALIFTHQHKDHTAGMDDVRSYNFRQEKDMPIYARAEVIAQIRQEFSYVFSEFKYPGIPSVEIHTIENKPFTIGALSITPIEVMHHQLPVFGYRIGNFTYITDANFIAPEEIEKMKGTEILVLNALQKEAHISHFSLEQALEIIDRVQPRKAYLTHLSHRMGTHRAVSPELPEGVELAYDGLKINI